MTVWFKCILTVFWSIFNFSKSFEIRLKTSENYPLALPKASQTIPNFFDLIHIYMILVMVIVIIIVLIIAIIIISPSNHKLLGWFIFFDEYANKKMPGPGPGPRHFFVFILVNKNKSAEQWRRSWPLGPNPGKIITDYSR